MQDGTKGRGGGEREREGERERPRAREREGGREGEGGCGGRGLTKSLADAGADSEVRNIVVVHHIEVHHVSAYT
jgi:hypothetical protein